MPEDTPVQAGDVIVGKVMPQKQGSAIINRDTSVALKSNERGFVDRNCYGNRFFTNTTGDGYTFAKVRLRSERVPAIGDKVSCYAPDHEVLTTQGWVPVAEVTTDHRVASLVEGRDGLLTLVYQQPVAVQAYAHEGAMYEVRSNHVDLLVTMNHRMYVGMRHDRGRYYVQLADEVVGARRHYKKNVDAFEPVREDARELVLVDGAWRFRVPEFSIDYELDAWLSLYGIWLAEGSVSSSGVSFAAHKQRVKAALEAVLPRLGMECGKYRDKEHEGAKWYLRGCTKTLGAYLTSMPTGAVNKELPQWAWALDRAQCRALIDGMVLGDGHTMANGTRRYDTSSANLADGFQRLCLHAGFSCNKTVKYPAGHSAVGKYTTVTSTVDAYRLTIITSQNEPLVNKCTENKADRVVESWKGTVHCVTVAQGPGVIYVRRNGVPIWCGNSRHGTWTLFVGAWGMGSCCQSCHNPRTQARRAPSACCTARRTCRSPRAAWCRTSS